MRMLETKAPSSSCCKQKKPMEPFVFLITE